MKIARWKTKEVLMNHYVYGKVSGGFTTNLLGRGDEQCQDSQLYTEPIKQNTQQ